jgi:hypothetical protein
MEPRMVRFGGAAQQYQIMSTTPRTDAQFIPHPDEPAPTMQIHDEVIALRAENADLRKALDAQMLHQRELRADRDRLDWLDHNAIPWRWMSPEKIDQLGPLVITWKGNRSLRLELDNQMTDATK